MTTNEIRAFAKKYGELTDKELAKEFVDRDILVLKFWKDTPQDLSDEHQIIQDLMIERFVRKARIGLVWSDNYQAWINPAKCSCIGEHEKITYWIES